MKQLVAFLALLAPWAAAHVGPHPSVHDTVAAIKERMKRDLAARVLVALTSDGAEKFLTKEERHILGTEHIALRVNVPVVVSVVRPQDAAPPFWLKDRMFERTELAVQAAGKACEVWRKQFPAGEVGLGVNSLRGGGDHYFVAIAPRQTSAKLAISDIYPGQHTLGALEVGALPYVDRKETVDVVPPELRGHTLLRTQHSRRNDAQLVGLFRATSHPASDRPDHIVLTWSEDPRTTQTIQWRTSTSVAAGVVAYQRKRDYRSFNPKKPLEAKAVTESLATPDVINDPVVYRHAAVLRGLEPDTQYVYAVGDGSDDGWTELAEFTTAPRGVKPFSFVYMGDAQNGLDRWGTLVRNAYRTRPDAAFYMMAGDLVNRGAERDDWDSLFANAAGIYDRRPLVPALGNHECQGGEPNLYLSQFALPRNGPTELGPERAYSFEYSNACFVVLDSNQPPATQSAWLEDQLAATKATWKFVMYHHPAYSSAPNRDNKSIRDEWVPIFDRHHVDMALQGHDHAYLRTFPMRGDQRVETTKQGTVYIVSVSGTKMYQQDQRDYTEIGFTNTATYQVLDIQISGDRLVYRAVDIDGKVRDELVIEK
jgi:hypothetical protein